ncbi:cell division protein FtsQ [Paenibacillus sepulcri]
METAAYNRKPQNQSQNLMVFVLSMALFGLADLVTEMIPDVEIGPIEIGIPYFGFVGLILVALFNPLYAALGAAVGEVIFGDLLMGDFGGIGELEGVLTLFIGLYIAGLLVNNSKNRLNIAIAGMIGIGIEQLLGGVADVIKVSVGVSELEAVEGLPQSIVLLELVENVNEWIISGIIVGILPAMFMLPRLHGKLEPLLGIKPRTNSSYRAAAGSLLALSAGIFIIAVLFGVLGESLELGAWEPDFIDQYGGGFVWVGIGIAALVAIAVMLIAFSSRKSIPRQAEKL